MLDIGELIEVFMQGNGTHPCKQAFSDQLALGISHYGIWSVSNPHTEDLSKRYSDFLEMMKSALEWEMLNNSNNNDSTILDRENLQFQHWSSKNDGN